MITARSKLAISFLAPEEKYLLEEANLPGNLIDRVGGQNISAEIHPEEAPATRRVEPDDCPLLIDSKGNYWNDYRPIRVLYTDEQSQVWRFPRRWLPMFQPITEPRLESMETVWQEATFNETLTLPTEWDLWEINIPWRDCHKAGGKAIEVEIRIRPGELAMVSWRDPLGNLWRIPLDWRRRLIKLPKYDVLTLQQIPAEVAERVAETIVIVNYHPGSLCCLRDSYRFRDSLGNRWPVRILDCFVVGYGRAPGCGN
jgi:hypothetical protein